MLCGVHAPGTRKLTYMGTYAWGVETCLTASTEAWLPAEPLGADHAHSGKAKTCNTSCVVAKGHAMHARGGREATHSQERVRSDRPRANGEQKMTQKQLCVPRLLFTRFIFFK